MENEKNTENAQDDFETSPGEVVGGPQPEDITPEDIAPVIDGWPEPTKAAQTDVPPAENVPRGTMDGAPIKDAKHRVFDPAIHAANPDGSPRYNKNGLFIFRGVGRKGSAAKDEKEDYGADNYDAQAENFLRLYYGGMSTVFDDDGWQPENEAEHEFLKQPAARVMREMQMPQMPAKLEFAVAFAAFNIKRSQRPKTKEKLILLWLRVRSWFGKKKPDLPPVEDGKKQMDDSTPKAP
jgi:hypothetical protein